jgi:hypothetical protein
LREFKEMLLLAENKARHISLNNEMVAVTLFNMIAAAIDLLLHIYGPYIYIIIDVHLRLLLFFDSTVEAETEYTYHLFKKMDFSFLVIVS